MGNKSVLLRLHDKFVAKAEYYEDHPMFPAYCMNATARAYREAAAEVQYELEELCHGKTFEEIRTGEQAEPRADATAPASGSLPGGGEEAQRGSGKEEG